MVAYYSKLCDGKSRPIESKTHIQKISNFLRDAFLFSVARSLRLQILAILNTANSVATGHNKLFPNKHCEIFMPVQKKKLNVLEKEVVCLRRKILTRILASTMNYSTSSDLVIKGIWYHGFKTVVMENLLTK